MSIRITEFCDFINDEPVKAIVREYINSLPFDISYQDFEKELADLSVLYSEPNGGALFVAYENDALAGCVALKKLDASSCEMKRLYVRPSFRGKKAGRLLAEALIRKAIALGYQQMKLDTDTVAHANAIALYRQLGFRETKPYHQVPHPFLFMALDLEQLKKQNMSITVSPFHKTISADLSIIEYTPEHAAAFKALNEAWISKSFFLEESDIAVLSDPQKYILAPGAADPARGGAILLAEYKGQIIGTCALTYEGHDTYELTKMAVDENFRGLKIGWHLGMATLEKAKQLGAKKVILHSNRKGSAVAIRLYYKLGFVEIPLGNAPWARADIKMEINI